MFENDSKKLKETNFIQQIFQAEIESSESLHQNYSCVEIT